MPILRRSVRHNESRPISSHARKRESGGGRPLYRRGFSYVNAATDSRFRGNDEVLSYVYYLPPRHFFGVPAAVMRSDGFFTHSFAGMTKCYWRIIVFCRAEPFGARTVMVRAIPTNTRHSRESGNPGAAVRYIGTLYYGNAATDSRFRGNDEVLSYGYYLPPRHFFGVPAAVMRSDGFFTHSFAGITKCYWRIIVFCRAEPFGARTVMVRAIPTNTRHSRESGNPEAAVRYTGAVFLTETLRQIPAFAGMTRYYRMVIVFHRAISSAFQPP